MKIIATAITAICLAGAASAATITADTTTGAVIAAPAAVNNATPGNNDEITWAFNEITGLVLSAALNVGGVTLAAGTVVDSHMIFLNRDGSSNANPLDVSISQFSFSEAILAVITTSGQVNSTSSLLGAPGTTYGNLDGFEGNDYYQLIDSDTIEVGMYVTQPGDWIRVVTASADTPAVPLPAGGLLLLSGLGAIGALRRRR